MAIFEILVVDDEEEFRELTIKRLKKRGLICEGAASGEEALEQIKARSFDVVLLDVKMPGMNGIEALREIKRISPLIEVVMLTGHASVETGIDGMKNGAFDYLMKPMELAPLLEKLTDAYQKKKAHQDKIEMAMIRKDMQRPC